MTNPQARNLLALAMSEPPADPRQSKLSIISRRINQPWPDRTHGDVRINDRVEQFRRLHAEKCAWHREFSRKHGFIKNSAPKQ